MYRGWPGDNDAAKLANNVATLKLSFSTLLLEGELNHEAKVVGNKIMLEAKIGGITPAIFSFSGKCDDCPAYNLFPTCFLA